MRQRKGNFSVHPVSKPLVLSLLFSVLPGIYTGVALAQSYQAPQHLPDNATLGGSYSYNFSGNLSWPYMGVWPFALTQFDNSTFNGMNLSLSTSGANLTLTGLGSVPQSGGIGGIAQQSVGMGAAAGDTPSGGGTSGWVTTNLANMTLNLQFLQAGWAPSALYGLYAYAGPVHYGWPERGIAPHPFVIDAADATRSEWLDVYADELQQLADKVAGTY